jgi:hypothetical protein
MAQRMFSYEYEFRDTSGQIVSTGQVTLEYAVQLGDELDVNRSKAVVVDIQRSSTGGGRLMLAPSPLTTEGPGKRRSACGPIPSRVPSFSVGQSRGRKPQPPSAHPFPSQAFDSGNRWIILLLHAPIVSCALRPRAVGPRAGGASALLPKSLRGPSPLAANAAVCRHFPSAPGRIRTCDPRIRSPPLCPLSYRRSRPRYHRDPSL